MTNSKDALPAATNGQPDDAGDDDVKNWLRGALDRESVSKVDVLAGVQQKLRERSGGKFYADLWSTAKQPPIATFLVTSLIMLAVVLAAYAILAPLRGTPEVVPTQPEPVQVVSPK